MSKKILFIMLGVVILGIGVFIWFYLKSEILNVNNFDECVAANYSVSESYPRQCRTPNGKLFTEDIGNELEKTDRIIINNPRPNQTAQSPLSIFGTARGSWYFEASFPIKIYDENNNLLGTTIAQAQEDWMTTNFVPFSATLNFIKSNTKKGWLVLERDNPSGLSQNNDELKIPVVFGNISSDKIDALVYFNNSKMDPESSCNKVFPVIRKIQKTQAIARAALEELLKGPTEEEKALGFFTSINSGVKIQSLVIENKIAKVYFNDQLQFQVGGSCKVSAIRSEIIQTLKQFSTITDVIISINGRTEDILQP